MAEFSASDAALTGFRVVWQHPWAVAAWAALQCVFALGQALFVAVSLGPTVTRFLESLMQPAGVGSAAQRALARQMAPTMVAVLIASLVLSAVLLSAMNRAVLRPTEGRFGYLRLASDELRQLGLLVVLGMVAFLIYTAVFCLALALDVIVSLVLGDQMVGVVLTVSAAVTGMLCALIYFGVRFSLASPLTFVGGRIDLMGSWRLTRGRFWPLLGAYAIAFALRALVFVLVWAIALLLVASLSGSFSPAAFKAGADMSTPQAVLAPAQLVYLTIMAIGAALAAPITLTPPAAILQALAARGEVRTA